MIIGSSYGYGPKTPTIRKVVGSGLRAKARSTTHGYTEENGSDRFGWQERRYVIQ